MFLKGWSINSTIIKLSPIKKECFMVRQGVFAGVVVVCMVGMMMGCSKEDGPNENSITGPVGDTVKFSEGFGDALSKWRDDYMIVVGDNYPKMRITDEAAHTGTHSITSDSNRTALQAYIAPQLYTGVVGVQFYIMAKAPVQTNFTVEIGQNNGSSGGLGKAFGIGFDMTDSVKCSYYDSWTGHKDTMIAPIELNKWYKCNVEVDMDAVPGTISYYLDDILVRTLPLPTGEWYGIDRLLVFRGLGDYTQDGSLIPSADGVAQYYADDIVVYKKP
jgi:hypothetical protein